MSVPPSSEDMIGQVTQEQPTYKGVRRTPSGKVSLVKESDPTAREGLRNSARLLATYRTDRLFLVRLVPLLNYLTIASLVLMIGLMLNFSSTNFRVFPTTQEGRLTAPPALDEDVGDNVVAFWTVGVIYRSMMMGFHDYQIRMERARPYFTDLGWTSFNAYLNATQNRLPSLMTRLKTGFWTMTPRLSETPTVIEKSLIGGVYTYKVRAAITLSTDGLSNSGGMLQVLDLTIERTDDPSQPQGLVISQWRLSRGQK